MELQGKVIVALDQRSGESARGRWVSQDFVIETHDTYPRKMVFTVWGEDRLQRFNIEVGQEVNVSFDIDAREYQGRWYTSIRAFDVRQVATQATVAPIADELPPFEQNPTASVQNVVSENTDPLANAESADDLPF